MNGHRVVRFSGAASQFLTVAASNSVISGATNFTVSLVFTATNQGAASAAFFLNTGLLGGDQPFAVADWALCLNGSQLGAGLGASSGNCSADTSIYGGTVTDGKPHLATYVRSADTIGLFLDGEMVATQPGLCIAARGNFDALIGAMTTNLYFFSGDMAEIQFYPRALSAAELGVLHEALATRYGMSGVAGAPSARWVADSLTGNDGSSVSNWVDLYAGKSAAQTTVSKQPRIYSNSINGHKVVRFASAASQNLTVAAVDDPIVGAGSFTLSVVFRTSTGGNASTNFYLNTGLLATEQSGVVGDWALCVNGSQLGAGLGGGANGCGADLSLYGGLVTDGNPHIATYLRSGDSINLYVDGALVVSQSSLCSLERGAYDMQIGAMTTNLYFYNGDIAEIQLYNRALTPSELTVQNEQLAATYGIGSAAAELVVWGSNSNGQTNTPATLTNVSVVAAGADFNLALNASGGLTGWGNNTSGQTAGLPGLTNVSLLAGGTGFAVAIGNQTPLATGLTNSGFVNHDLTLTLPGVDPDGNPFNLRLASFPTLGSLYQYSGGARGAAITAASNTVADASGRVIFAPADANTGVPYAAFDFFAQDSYYSSATAHAAVNLSLPAAPQFSVASLNAPGNQFNLGFLGSSNATYSLWASSNLTSWIKIGTAAEVTPGYYQFADSLANGWPTRFYSARVP